MKFVFMNHRIRQPRPSGPVIVCQSNVGTEEANHFDLMLNGVKIGSVRYSGRGLKACETHHVRAWVELDDSVTVEAR